MFNQLSRRAAFQVTSIRPQHDWQISQTFFQDRLRDSVDRIGRSDDKPALIGAAPLAGFCGPDPGFPNAVGSSRNGGGLEPGINKPKLDLLT